MELIVEITDQSGRSHQYRKVAGEKVTIGRAWDNDLILNDPAVNPHHVVITQDETNRLLITDLDSLNGTNNPDKQRIQGSAPLQVGEEYLIGKSRICFYTPDYPVVETVKVADIDHSIRLLDDTRLLVGASLLVTLLYAGEQWLNMFSGFKWQEIANVLLVVYAGVIGLTLFWVVIGRVLRHEIQFRKHLTLILIFTVIQYLTSKLFALIMFNTLNMTLSLAMMVFSEFVLVAGLLWFNLYLATNQTNVQRTRTAIMIASVMIALTLYSEIASRAEFSDSPDYIKVLVPPALQFGGGVSEDEFLSGASKVFTRLDTE